VSLQKEIIDELNDLSLQYSKWLISYEDFRSKRHELLESLEQSGSVVTPGRSIVTEMVNSFSDLIKRS
jgi:hypothetical protein